MEAPESCVEETAQSILTVDDEDLVRRTLARTLSRAGFNVTTAQNGQEAFELVTANPHSFDLILSDQTMPRMTGRKLAESLASEGSKVPIVLMSGVPIEGLTDQAAVAANIASVIMKPIRKSDLLSTVSECLEKPSRDTSGRG